MRVFLFHKQNSTYGLWKYARITTQYSRSQIHARTWPIQVRRFKTNERQNLNDMKNVIVFTVTSHARSFSLCLPLFLFHSAFLYLILFAGQIVCSPFHRLYSSVCDSFILSCWRCCALTIHICFMLCCAV